MQMVERLAYWSVLLQMPIYIAQKDVAGGLHWSHIEKGFIYFWWALVQNLTPLFSGYIADKFGRKIILRLSFIIIILGFIFMSVSKDFLPFFLATLTLGFGLGSFKPIIQGSIAGELNDEISSFGWGLYVMLVNLSVFLAPPISILLKSYNWSLLFWGSAVLFSLNFIFISLYKENKKIKFNNIHFGIFFKNLFSSELIKFLLFMSGFTIVYMQFYETLPNYIYDWVDTSSVAKWLHLPESMLMTTPTGKMIAFEWLYNLNTGLIVLFVTPIAIIFHKFRITKVISFGVLIASIGLGFCGFFYVGSIVMLGFVIYTFGEMIANPKFTEYLGILAPRNLESTFLSYLNISWAIGLAGGGLLGGYLYNAFGEKATLAKRYLFEVLHYTQKIDLNQSINKIQQITGDSQVEITKKLFNQYSPELIWLPFILLGVLSAVSLFLLNNKPKESIK